MPSVHRRGVIGAGIGGAGAGLGARQAGGGLGGILGATMAGGGLTGFQQQQAQQAQQHQQQQQQQRGMGIGGGLAGGGGGQQQPGQGMGQGLGGIQRGLGAPSIRVAFSLIRAWFVYTCLTRSLTRHAVCNTALHLCCCFLRHYQGLLDVAEDAS